MGKLTRKWFNANQSAAPYESVSGAGMIIPANDDHVLLWDDYTYGFTECTDTNNGNKYVYRTVKTSSSSTTRHAGCANGETWNETDHPDESGETLSGWTETISGGGTSAVSFVADKLQLFFKNENSTTKKISYLRNTKQNYLETSEFDYWVNFKRTVINSDFTIWFGLFNSGVNSPTPNSIIFTVTNAGAPYFLVSNSVGGTKYSIGSDGDIVIDTEYWARTKSDGTTMTVDFYTSYADMVAETGSIRTLSILVETIVGTITCDRFGFMNQGQEFVNADETWLVGAVDGDVCDDWDYTTNTQNVYYLLYSTNFCDSFLTQDGRDFRLRDGGGRLVLCRTNSIPIETYIITQPMFTISSGLNADYTAGEWKYNGNLYSIESGTTALLDDKTDWHVYLEGDNNLHQAASAPEGSLNILKYTTGGGSITKVANLGNDSFNNATLDAYGENLKHAWKWEFDTTDSKGDLDLTPQYTGTPQSYTMGNGTSFIAIAMNKTYKQYFTNVLGFSQGVTKISASCWIKLNSIGTQHTILYDSTDSSASDDRFRLFISTFGKISVVLKDDLGEAMPYTDLTLSTDTWYHILMSANTTGDTIRIFVNGSAWLDTTISSFNPSGGTPYRTMGPLDNTVSASGTYLGHKSGSSTDYFNGTIDEVYIWHDDLNLTAAQLLSNEGQGRYWMPSE
jgi:hypothetical protein